MTTYPPQFLNLRCATVLKPLLTCPFLNSCLLSNSALLIHCAISEIEVVEVVGINGSQFVDLESKKSKLIMLRAKSNEAPLPGLAFTALRLHAGGRNGRCRW
jgi:hypothetical protein